MPAEQNTPVVNATPGCRTVWDDRQSRSVRQFLATETGSAGLLLLATVVALIWANSPARNLYEDLWGTYFTVGIDGVGAISEDLQHWVNDGLMALFFYVVGLEITRELKLGELRNPRAAAVPAIGAVAGMVAPAALYLAINWGGPGQHGWGIVMATDIAFVVGALALLGDRVPSGVRVFLLTLAIVDDVGAIAVIAIFYSDDLSFTWLAAAGVILAAIVLLRRFGPPWRGPTYFLAGLVLWVATLESGIHPTIAGVAMGLLTAVRPPGRAEIERAAIFTRVFRAMPSPRSGREAVLEIGNAVSANERFQHGIHPWTSMVIIPIFALANAGVELSSDTIAAITSPVTLGVIVGLFIGKSLGITTITLAAVQAKVGPLPHGVRRRHIGGAATLAGIGFTVSLFVADLAFTDEALRDQAKLGVLIASLLAAVVGVFALSRVKKVDAQTAHMDDHRPLRPKVDPAYDRIRGSLDAPHTLTAYLDYECPWSRRLAPVLERLLEEHGDRVNIAVRHVPLENEHPDAMLAAEAALAAGAQGRFWEMHDRLLEHPEGDDLGPADLIDLGREVGLDADQLAEELRHHVRQAAVTAELDSAEQSGVQWTPTLFLGDTRLDGEYTVEHLVAAMDRVDDGEAPEETSRRRVTAEQPAG